MFWFIGYDLEKLSRTEAAETLPTNVVLESNHCVWASLESQTDKSSLIPSKLGPGIVKPRREGKSWRAPNKGNCFLWFLMLACGSVAFLHLWQYTTHCHIRPALCRGQIAILLQDEVSPRIDYISTITLGKKRRRRKKKKKKRGQFHFMSRYTCAHTPAERRVAAASLAASTQRRFGELWFP